MIELPGYRRPTTGTQPDYLFPRYVATQNRSPKQPLVWLPHTLSEITGPVFGHQEIGEHDNDLTAQHRGEPIGERIIVSGRVLDENGKPVPHTLVEIWQANAAGRYLHIGLTWLTSDDFAPGAEGERVTISGRVLDGDGLPVNDAMLEVWQADPEGRYAHPEGGRAPLTGFRGWGRVATDANGQYRFQTVKPGKVRGPEGQWQAPHLVVAIFMRGILRQLVTRIYFPGEPANALDPVLARVPEGRRTSLIAKRSADDILAWDVILQGDAETVFFDC